MPVESYVLMPLHRYEKMEEDLLSKPSPAASNSEPTVEKADKEDAELKPEETLPALEPEPEPDIPTKSGLSKKVKKLAKKNVLGSTHFEKLLRAIEMYKGENQLNLSNLPELVRQACGRSAKTLENERPFYMWLIQKNMLGYVKNVKKLAQHFPYFMRV